MSDQEEVFMFNTFAVADNPFSNEINTGFGKREACFVFPVPLLPTRVITLERGLGSNLVITPLPRVASANFANTLFNAIKKSLLSVIFIF